MEGALNQNDTKMKIAESGLVGCWMAPLTRTGGCCLLAEALLVFSDNRSNAWKRLDGQAGHNPFLFPELSKDTPKLPTKLVAASLNHNRTQRS